MTEKPRLFPGVLTDTIPSYGSAAAIAVKAGLSTSTITRAARGESALSADAVESVIAHMSPADRAALTFAWALDTMAQIPSGNAVRVVLDGATPDRLQRALDLLPPDVRAALTHILESCNADPHVGHTMLTSLAGLIQPTLPARPSDTRLNEPGTPYGS